jgi:hypothetical protein
MLAPLSLLESDLIAAAVFSGSSELEMVPSFGVAVPGVSVGVVTISKGALS